MTTTRRYACPYCASQHYNNRSKNPRKLTNPDKLVLHCRKCSNWFTPRQGRKALMELLEQTGRDKTLSRVAIEDIKDRLQSLRDSCYQGEDGSWDCSSDEGKEGFLAMAEALEEIANLIGVDLDEYRKEEEE